MLLAGIYKAVIKKHWFTTSAMKGTPGLAVKVEISDEWDEGQTFVGTIWLSPNAMGMARSQLKALGFDCDTHELSELEGEVSLVDRAVDVELREEDFRGKTELKIARFGGSAPKPTKDALSSATKELRAAKKAAKESESAAKATPAAKPVAEKKATPPSEPFPDVNAQPQEESGDDIPF